MPDFRESLRTRVIDKTERLLKRIDENASPNIDNLDSERRNMLNNLRGRQKLDLSGFAQPKSFSISGYQSNTQKFLTRLLAAIRKFVSKTTSLKPSLIRARPLNREFQSALRSLIEKSRRRVTDLARAVISGALRVSEFVKSLTAEIRRVNLGAGLLAVKSLGSVTANVLEIIQARTSKQLNYLDTFVQNLRDQFDTFNEFTQTQASQIVTSVQRYIAASKSTFSSVQKQILDDIYGDREGDEEVLAMRVLGSGGKSGKHCSDCPPISGYFMPLEDLVPIGDTLCGSSCTCYVVYDRASKITDVNRDTSVSMVN